MGRGGGGGGGGGGRGGKMVLAWNYVRYITVASSALKAYR